MIPFKILGLSKSPSRVFITLEKRQGIVPCLEHFLEDLGFTWLETHGFFRPETLPKKDPFPEEVDTDVLADIHHSFVHEDCQVDFIFGVKKVFLIIVAERDHQNEIVDALTKFTSY